MNTYKEIIEYFVRRKRKMGWSISSDYWWSSNNYKVPECTMSAWYKEARDLHSLGGHYNTFRDCVENEIYYDREAYRRSRAGRWYYRQTGGAYVKQPHHKKKELSEDQIRKREWRKKVKDPRDQDHKKNYYGRKKPYIRSGNRAERRATKMKLKSGDWKNYPRGFWEQRWDESKQDFYDSWYLCYPENDWDTWLSRKNREWVDPWDWN